MFLQVTWSGRADQVLTSPLAERARARAVVSLPGLGHAEMVRNNCLCSPFKST